VDRPHRAWTSPALRAVQTAQALGLDAAVEPLLADLNLGAWAGKTLAQVEAEDAEALALWMRDPACAPHGGESVAHLLKRVACWLDQLGEEGRVIAVTHSAVIRAATLIALDAPAKSFWRIDVAPLSLSRLFARNGRWTVRSLNELTLKND
jgi:broad specificity phosphatase PhoE